jgi:NHL repeat
MSSVFVGPEYFYDSKINYVHYAPFKCPYGIAIDQQTGTLFVSDVGNHNIIEITPQGKPFFFLSSCIVVEYFDQDMYLEKCKDFQMVF